MECGQGKEERQKKKKKRNCNGRKKKKVENVNLKLNHADFFLSHILMGPREGKWILQTSDSNWSNYVIADDYSGSWVTNLDLRSFHAKLLTANLLYLNLIFNRIVY